MHPIDRQLIQFVVQWLPYGGPPEVDAMVEFGLTSEQTIERCRDLVGAALGRRMPAGQVDALLRGAAVLLGGTPTLRR